MRLEGSTLEESESGPGLELDEGNAAILRDFLVGGKVFHVLQLSLMDSSPWLRSTHFKHVYETEEEEELGFPRQGQFVTCDVRHVSCVMCHAFRQSF